MDLNLTTIGDFTIDQKEKTKVLDAVASHYPTGSNFKSFNEIFENEKYTSIINTTIENMLKYKNDQDCIGKSKMVDGEKTFTLQLRMKEYIHVFIPISKKRSPAYIYLKQTARHSINYGLYYSFSISEPTLENGYKGFYKNARVVRIEEPNDESFFKPQNLFLSFYSDGKGVMEVIVKFPKGLTPQEKLVKRKLVEQSLSKRIDTVIFLLNNI